MRVKTKMPELLPRPIGNILRKLTHLGGGQTPEGTLNSYFHGCAHFPRVDNKSSSVARVYLN